MIQRTLVQELMEDWHSKVVMKEKLDSLSYITNTWGKPISMYYKNKYGIPYNKLRIVSVSDTVVPAKEITFFIDEYPSDRIVQDIERDLILFNIKPSVVRLTSDSFVYMII